MNEMVRNLIHTHLWSSDEEHMALMALEEFYRLFDTNQNYEELKAEMDAGVARVQAVIGRG